MTARALWRPDGWHVLYWRVEWPAERRAGPMEREEAEALVEEMTGRVCCVWDRAPVWRGSPLW